MNLICTRRFAAKEIAIHGAAKYLTKHACGMRVIAGLMVGLALSSHSQESQFTFDANGNLLTESPATVAPPQILSQPQPQVVGPGELASFFVVVADSRTLTYQWRFNGGNIGSATNETLLLQNVGATNEGQYSVVLANPSGSVTSAPAMLWFDGEGDGLPDSWELAYFGNLNQYGARDFDNDGVSNSQEFLDTTSPTNRASARFRLTVSTDGGGQVQVSPALLSYTNGQTVTLTATPAAPNIFRGWTGDLITQSNPVTLTMTSNRNVLALFFGLHLMWTNRLNGDWHVAANWRPNVVPTSNDTVFIAEGVTVTNNGVAECGRLFLGPSAPNWPTLTGNGTLTLYGDSVWLEGTMSGTGRTIVAPGATLSIAREWTLNAVTLRTRTLENAGTILWIGGNLDTDGGVITNRPGAVFEVQNASVLLSVSGFGLGRFDNAGIFRKTSSETTTIGQFTAFNNYGDVEIQDGTLLLQGGGRNEGAMTLHAGATLHLPGSTFTSTAGSSFSGAGNLIVSGGTHNLAGLVHLEGTHTFSGGTANFTGDHSCTNNTIIISSTANFSGTGLIMPATVSLSGGALAGSSALNVLNEFNWTGGTMSGSGRTVIVPGAVLNISSSAVHFLSGGRTVENGGTILWSGGFLTMGGATITNRAGALFDNQTAVTVNSGGGNRFDNAGTFRKVNAGTTSWPLPFNNSGVVEIEAGRLTLGGGGTHSGTFEIAAGASLNFGGGSGTHAADAASIITGAGDFIVNGGPTVTLAGLVNATGVHTFSGGTVNLNGTYNCTNNPATISGATVNFNTTSAVPVLNFSSGTMGGSGVLNVLETMNWSGGNMLGSGRTVIAPTATLNFITANAVTITSRTLENGGTVIWTGAGNLTGSGAVITNRPSALFELRNNTSFAPQGFVPWRFDNAGTLRKSIATGTSTFAAGVNLTNYNRVEIRSGILAANGYISTSNALLNCALGGTTPGTGFGRLQVAGTANLNGSLSVDLINGFIPTINDSFTVLTAGTRSGTFANFYYPSNDVTMQLSNAPTAVIVRVTDVLVIPRPMLLQPELVGPDIKLTWTAVSNATYRLEFNPDLANLTNWNPVAGDVTTTSNTASKLDALTASNRLYRVRVVP